MLPTVVARTVLTAVRAVAIAIPVGLISVGAVRVSVLRISLRLRIPRRLRIPVRLRIPCDWGGQPGADQSRGAP